MEEKNNDVITLCSHHHVILPADEKESRFPPQTNPPKELLVSPCTVCLEMAFDLGMKMNKEIDGIDINEIIGGENE